MTETVLGDRLFVGGEWVESSATGKTFDVVNPANGEVLATLPDGGEAEIRNRRVPRRQVRLSGRHLRLGEPGRFP